MGCCGGHFEMHDDREKRRTQQRAHQHHDAELASSPEVEQPSINRWIAPLLFGVGAALLYLILR